MYDGKEWAECAGPSALACVGRERSLRSLPGLACVLDLEGDLCSRPGEGVLDVGEEFGDEDEWDLVLRDFSLARRRRSLSLPFSLAMSSLSATSSSTLEVGGLGETI